MMACHTTALRRKFRLTHYRLSSGVDNSTCPPDDLTQLPFSRNRMQFLNLIHHPYDLSRTEVTATAVGGLTLAFAMGFLAHPAIAAATGYLAFTMALIVLIDLRHFTIPDGLSLPAIPLGLVANSLAFGEFGWYEPLADSVVAAGVAAGALYAIRHAYFMLRGIEGLGLGDVKLAAAAGAWAGLGHLAATCLLASGAALAAIFLHSLAARSGKPTLQTAVPFGSFIALAILVVWVWRLILL